MASDFDVTYSGSERSPSGMRIPPDSDSQQQRVVQTNGAVPPWCPLGSFFRPSQPQGGGGSPPPGPRAALCTTTAGPPRFPRLYTGAAATVAGKESGRFEEALHALGTGVPEVIPRPGGRWGRHF